MIFRKNHNAVDTIPYKTQLTTAPSGKDDKIAIIVSISLCSVFFISALIFGIYICRRFVPSLLISQFGKIVYIIFFITMN